MRAQRRGVQGESAVVGYVRVSTDDQQLSVEAQRKRITEWCQAHGLPLQAVCEDIGVSGGAALDKRPGLMSALDQLKPGMVLLAIKRDRLARDTMNAAMIDRLAEKAGARVLTCDGASDGDGPEAILLRKMVDAFAEYERALIRARTKAALQRKRDKGERLGSNVPYGSCVGTDGRTLTLDIHEQGMVAAITAYRSTGLSQRAIVVKMAQEGYTTRKGTALSLMQVQRIIAASGVM